MLTSSESCCLLCRAIWNGGVRARNVTIRGRGIVCGRHTFEKRQRHKMVRVQFADEVHVEGIILRESSGWNMMLDHASQVHVDNVKIIAHFANSDGMDLSGLTDSVVSNSFVHNGDDVSA
jgi:polygalacturonase